LTGGVNFQIAIGVYLAIELLSLQVDIFNLNMAKSENSIGIGQGPIAPLLNWVYMVINFIIIFGTACFVIVILVRNQAGSGIIIGFFFAFNLPGLVLMFTQVNALLYIYKAKNVSIPPKPTQTGADARVAKRSNQMRAMYDEHDQ
jgi:hypothetical protein